MSGPYTVERPASPDEWLRETFEYEWCAECGRDHRHHRALLIAGLPFVQCEREPLFDARGNLVPNPEGYPE